MSLPNFPGGGLGANSGKGSGISSLSDQELADLAQQEKMNKQIAAAMESCVGKSVMSAGAGFALGGAFGLFMASMSYDSSLTPQSQAMQNLPMKDQIKRGLKDMGARSFSSAKNFGMIGGIFAGTECVIEGLRAKNDMGNGIAAGCITGGALGVRAGPQAAAVGCAGFAAFSAAIDYYLRHM